jgi:hypothetical protein
MPTTNGIHWHKTHLPCPWGCGYVFDKGLQAADITGALHAVEDGITVCSRCKRALHWGGGALTKIDEASLSREDRLQLLKASAAVVIAEVCSGKRY